MLMLELGKPVGSTLDLSEKRKCVQTEKGLLRGRHAALMMGGS